MKAPIPYPAEHALKALGKNIGIARVRRRITIDEMAIKIGVTPKTIYRAENGYPGTSIQVYLSILWALNLLENVYDLANPTTDKEGLALVLAREPKRVRHKKALDNDF